MVIGVWVIFSPSAHKFCIQTEYEAPDTGFYIRMLSAGKVAAGEDLSADHRASALLCSSTNAAKSIRLNRVDHDLVNYEVADGESGTFRWNFRSNAAVLAEPLRTAGYPGSSADEIIETLNAFQNMVFGRKAIMMPGQTDHLIVKSVNLSAAQCESRTSDEWIAQELVKLNCSAP